MILRMVRKRSIWNWNGSSWLKTEKSFQCLIPTKPLVTKCCLKCWMNRLISRWRVSLQRFKKNKTKSFGIRNLICCSFRGLRVLGRPPLCCNGSPTCFTGTAEIWIQVKLFCSRRTSYSMIILTGFCLNWANRIWFRWLSINIRNAGFRGCTLKRCRNGLKKITRAQTSESRRLRIVWHSLMPPRNTLLSLKRAEWTLRILNIRARSSSVRKRFAKFTMVLMKIIICATG